MDTSSGNNNIQQQNSGWAGRREYVHVGHDIIMISWQLLVLNIMIHHIMMIYMI